MLRLSGTGAKVALALLLFGPMSLARLAASTGVSRRETLYKALNEAAAAGLALRVGRGMFAPVDGRLSADRLPPAPTERSVAERLQSEEREHVSSRHAVLVSGNRHRQRTWQIPTESVTKPTESVTIQSDVIPTESVYPQRIYTESVTKDTESVGIQSDVIVTESVYNRSGYTETVTKPTESVIKVTESVGNDDLLDPVTLLLGEAAAADLLTAEYTFPPQAAYIAKHRKQVEVIERLGKELFPASMVSRRSVEEWLRVSGNKAYFVATVLDEIAASGKQVESLFAYVKGAISRRVSEGNIPLIPVEMAQEEMTPELRANLDRVKALNIWGSDDE